MGWGGIVGWEATVVACQANKPQNSLAKLCINGSMAPGCSVQRVKESGRAQRESSDRLQLYVQIMQLNCCWPKRESERERESSNNGS